MSHDDKEQLEPPRWTPNFGPFDESALLMEIIAMWGVHGAHAQVCRMLIERAALSASVEQPMVYWSERDDNGEWQHYRATPEHAGKVMTERFAGRTAPIGPDNCLLSTERANPILTTATEPQGREVTQGEVRLHHPAPEREGEIAGRESLDPEGPGTDRLLVERSPSGRAERLDGGERPASSILNAEKPIAEILKEERAVGYREGHEAALLSHGKDIK